MQRLIYSMLNQVFMNKIEHEIFSFLRKKNKIIFDVGCFRGSFTSNLIREENKSGINSTFYLFDPNPKTKEYLKKIIQLKNIHYFNIAFDDSNTKKKFYLNNFFESSGSSLDGTIKDDKSWINTRKLFMRFVQPFKKIEDFSEIEVQTQTIDNFCSINKIDSIDILKIDTEGNEVKVLNGAKKLLQKNKISIIYVEILDTKKNFLEKEKYIHNFLKEYNFELKKKYQIKSLSFLSNLQATDNLFINKTLIK